MLDPANHCKGKRIHNNNNNIICFHYDEIKFPSGPKDYFMSYPILSFQVMTTSSDSSSQSLDWYPSEYMFRTKATEYCMALEKFSRSNEILLGGTFMRQNNIIFDIEKERLGFARASCNDDPNQIVSKEEMTLQEVPVGEQGSIPVFQSVG